MVLYGTANENSEADLDLSINSDSPIFNIYNTVNKLFIFCDDLVSNTANLHLYSPYQANLNSKQA